MTEEKSDKWELPEPIFRRSTGEVVKPSTRIPIDPEPDTLEPGLGNDLMVDPEADTLVPNMPEPAPIDPDPDMLELGPTVAAVDADEPDTLELEPTDEMAADSEVSVSESPETEDALAKLYAPPEGHVEHAAKAPAPASGIDVEPQPYVSEQFTADKIDVESDKPKPKRSMGPVMLALGFLLLLAVAAGFVALIYFLFFAGRNSSSGF